MSITKIYGGFNPAWLAGQLERQIVDDLAAQVEDKVHGNCVIAVSSWHEPQILVNDIKQLNPDYTFVGSLTDPLGPVEYLLQDIPGQVVKFGYVDNGLHFDFWAMACLKFFKKYNFEQLQPKEFKYVFLNYNRKPHRHRIGLVNFFEQYNLIDYGVVTLGNSKYTVNDNFNDYIAHGANDVVGDVGIPNDIYSLGNMDIWNSCFLNVVSETQFEYEPNVFVSEKIYKPIIGLRPFIINGSPGIYRYLQNLGFDCFEDLFPVNELSDETFIPGQKFKNHAIITNSIKNLLDCNLLDLYHTLIPRLLNNQKLFYEHARNQQLHLQFNSI